MALHYNDRHSHDDHRNHEGQQAADHRPGDICNRGKDILKNSGRVLFPPLGNSPFLQAALDLPAAVTAQMLSVFLNSTWPTRIPSNKIPSSVTQSVAPLGITKSYLQVSSFTLQEKSSFP